MGWWQGATLKETQKPESSSLLVGTLALNANRAKREYRTKIEQFKAAWQPGSQVVSWGMDDNDRVY